MEGGCDCEVCAGLCWLPVRRLLCGSRSIVAVSTVCWERPDPIPGAFCGIERATLADCATDCSSPAAPGRGCGRAVLSLCVCTVRLSAEQLHTFTASQHTLNAVASG